MMTEQVSEELRICYAIRLINEQLGILEQLMSGYDRQPHPKEEEYLNDSSILGERLLELSKKTEQGAAANP